MRLIGLASVDQNAHRIGVLAAQTLLNRIGGRSDAMHLILEPALVVRSSL